MAKVTVKHLRCNTCGGTYDSHQRDGLEYYHACAPLSAPEVAAAVLAGTIVLPVGETPEIAVLRRLYERPNLRDENIDPTGPAGTSAVMKAAGRGVTVLP
jgi:hypothetical protein